MFANMINSKSSQKHAFIWDTSFIINAKSWKLKEIFKSFLPLLSKTNLDQLIYEFQENFAVVSYATFLGHQIFSNPLPVSHLRIRIHHVHNGPDICQFFGTTAVFRHTSYLSREPRVYPCKFFLAGVNFYRFSAKNWHFRQILREKVTFFFYRFKAKNWRFSV